MVPMRQQCMWESPQMLCNCRQKMPIYNSGSSCMSIVGKVGVHCNCRQEVSIFTTETLLMCLLWVLICVLLFLPDWPPHTVQLQTRHAHIYNWPSSYVSIVGLDLCSALSSWVAHTWSAIADRNYSLTTKGSSYVSIVGKVGVHSSFVFCSFFSATITWHPHAHGMIGTFKVYFMEQKIAQARPQSLPSYVSVFSGCSGSCSLFLFSLWS